MLCVVGMYMLYDRIELSCFDMVRDRIVEIFVM